MGIEEIEKLWIDKQISNNGVREALKVRNVLKLFDEALRIKKSTNLKLNKCLKILGVK